MLLIWYGTERVHSTKFNLSENNKIVCKKEILNQCVQQTLPFNLSRIAIHLLSFETYLIMNQVFYFHMLSLQSVSCFWDIH